MRQYQNTQYDRDQDNGEDDDYNVFLVHRVPVENAS